jgi:hypothetical protein
MIPFEFLVFHVIHYMGMSIHGIVNQWISVTYELFLGPAILREHVFVHDPPNDQEEVGSWNNCDISQKEIFKAMFDDYLPQCSSPAQL